MNTFSCSAAVSVHGLLAVRSHQAVTPALRCRSRRWRPQLWAAFKILPAGGRKEGVTAITDGSQTPLGVRRACCRTPNRARVLCLSFPGKGDYRTPARLERCAPTVCRREHLGRQILGEGGADPPADEPVHRREVLPEGDLKASRVSNAQLIRCRGSPVHDYVLSIEPDPFQQENGAGLS